MLVAELAYRYVANGNKHVLAERPSKLGVSILPCHAARQPAFEEIPEGGISYSCCRRGFIGRLLLGASLHLEVNSVSSERLYPRVLSNCLCERQVTLIT